MRLFAILANIIKITPIIIKTIGFENVNSSTLIVYKIPAITEGGIIDFRILPFKVLPVTHCGFITSFEECRNGID